MERSWRKFPIFFPLLLIAVGVILLLNSTGVIEGSLGGILLRLWPLLLIVGGLDGLWRGDGYVFPVVWGGIGVLLLLSTLDQIDASVLSLIWRLWPFLLIAWGAELIVRRRTVWAPYAGLAVGAGLVVAMAAIALSASPAGNFHTVNLSQSLKGTSQAELTVRPGVGRLVVTRGATEEMLVTGSASLPVSQDVKRSAEVENGVLVTTLEVEGDTFSQYVEPSEQRLWMLRLSAAVGIRLKTDLGVGDQQLDVGGLSITNLDAHNGVGSIELVVAGQDQLEGKLDVGVGDITIIVPRNMLVDLKLNAGLGSVNVPEGVTLLGDRYVTTGDAIGRLKLDANVGVGSITVKYR